MAKPGTKDAAHIAAGAVDLAELKPLDPEVESRIRQQAEEQLDRRCGGCARRVGIGFKFTKMDIYMGSDAKPQVDVMHIVACAGDDDCNFAAACREEADSVEMIEYVWLGGEAPVGAEVKPRKPAAKKKAAAKKAAAKPDA